MANQDFEVLRKQYQDIKLRMESDDLLISTEARIEFQEFCQENATFIKKVSQEAANKTAREDFIKNCLITGAAVGLTLLVGFLVGRKTQ